MKKVLIVMLVAFIAVTAVFADFNKSNLNVEARVLGVTSQYGASYDYGKWEFGAELWTAASPLSALVNKGLVSAIQPSGISASATYQIAQGQKSDLALGGTFLISSAAGLKLYAVAEYVYEITAEHSVTARVQLPIGKDILDPATLISASSIGYRYSF